MKQAREVRQAPMPVCDKIARRSVSRAGSRPWVGSERDSPSAYRGFAPPRTQPEEQEPERDIAVFFAFHAENGSGSAVLGYSPSRIRRLRRALFHDPGGDLTERCRRHADPLMVLSGTAGAVRVQLATEGESVTIGVRWVRLMLGHAHELHEHS